MLCRRAALRLSARGRPAFAAYPAGPGIHEELQLLALAERECCSFAEWDVHQEADRVVLKITASAEGVAAIQVLFNAD